MIKDASTPSGAAFLVAGPAVGGLEPHASLILRLGQIGDLLEADPAWRVTRLVVDPLDARSDQADVERAFRSFAAITADVALVIAVGAVIDSGDGPALAISPDADGSATGGLALETIGSRLRASGATRVVFVLAGWSVPALGTEPEPIERAWLTALAASRPGDLVAVAADSRALRVIEALRGGFSGEAIDDRTGTITVRSLGAHLARMMPGLALHAPELADTVASPPPLVSQWDPRLMWRVRRGTAPPRGSVAPSDLVGAILPGRFRIDGFLAQGGFGTVYRARQLSIERDVAIKIVHADVDPSSPTGRLFVQEIQSVGRIDHRNVVRIYQADVTADGRLFFAMELLDGRDLEQIIAADGRLAPARALAFASQLLAGLGAAHDVGLIHADIKPANALVVPARDGERVILVDFGLSRLRAKDHSTRSVGGTPAYMAPEQLGNGRVDARSDLFAAALVLVTLLTGWRRRSRDALVPPLDEIEDPRLREALGRALAVDPADRFATAAEFAAALAAERSGPDAPAGRPLPAPEVLLPAEPGEPVDVESAWIDERAAKQVAYVVAEGRRAIATPAPSTTSGRAARRLPIGAAVVLAGVATVAAGYRLLQSRPRVVVAGSGTVLYGFLEPVRSFLEERSATVIPLESIQDVGTGGGFRSLRGGEVDLAAASGRFDQELPGDLRAADKLVIEIAVGFDETALFVRRDNPLREIDISAIRAHLCCGRGETLAAVTWTDLGLATLPLAGQRVAWTAFGRTAPPVPHDSTSSTILQADAWLCAPRQLCPSDRAADISADEVLTRRVTGPEVLALSTRSFATDQVVQLVTVDRQHRTHLDGRKVLWLYLAAARNRPIPAHLCRFLDAVLDPSLAARLAGHGKAQGLPDAARQRQRVALGLDDDSCDRRAVGERAEPRDIETRILRSPIAADIEIPNRWVEEAP
jgi:serine/threonine-protein kinase